MKWPAAISLAILLFVCHIEPGTAQQRAEAEIFENGEQIEIPSGLERQLTAANLTNWKQVTEEWFINRGHLDFRADSLDQSTDPPRLFVTRGCLYRLDQLSVTVDDIDASGLRLPSGGRFEGEPFTAELPAIIAGMFLSEMEHSGYLTAEFNLDRVEKNGETCTVSISATVFPGDRYRVKGVRFDGIVRNNPDYLKRVSGIHTGDRITPELLERGRRNLVNSDLFYDVRGGELIFVNGEPHIRYELEEQQLNFFDGLIGYLPQPDGGGQFAGYGDILLRNAIAEGNHLELRYEQLQPMVSKLKIGAGQQFIGGLPLRAQAELRFTQQDTTYLVRDLELLGGYRLFPGFELQALIRNDRSSVSELTGVAEPVSYDSRATFAGLGFRYRQLNRVIVPTRGFDARIMLEQGRRFITDDRAEEGRDRNFNQTILRGDLRGYIPLGRRQVLAPRVQGFFLESADYLVTDLFRFGGAESIRGFREDQFRASAVLWGDLEARFLLDRSSYVFLFGAYGIYERPQLITEQTDQFRVQDDLTSFGFGLAFQSPLGLIKFSYAVSPDENLANGNVHVGIRTGI